MHASSDRLVGGRAMELSALGVLAMALAVVGFPAASATTLTMHNLCPYPVWPVVTPNAGLPGIAGADGLRLDCNGLASLALPSGGPWSGRVVPRTGCGGAACACAGGCAIGGAPPATVAQVSVHGPPDELAEYSVSLVDGFNVPVVISPQAFAAGQLCPALGCPVDLNAACPGCAGGSAAACTQQYKAACPNTRTTATDVEATPQNCHDPGELKIIFCPTG